VDPYQFDHQILSTNLAGVDEVGRGPLAGPVVAAAVILPPSPQIEGLADSKMLSAEQREALFCEIQEVAVDYSFSIVDVEKIDAINILQASLMAMRQAVHGLRKNPDMVLVDGNQLPGSGFRERAIIKGDQLSASIMAASILAKVIRDDIMTVAHQTYPQYGFNEHKGYGAPQHLQALHRFGPCPLHRKSFAPVRDWKKVQLELVS
jgi:ribonuclease HII